MIVLNRVCKAVALILETADESATTTSTTTTESGVAA